MALSSFYRPGPKSPTFKLLLKQLGTILSNADEKTVNFDKQLRMYEILAKMAEAVGLDEVNRPCQSVEPFKIRPGDSADAVRRKQGERLLNLPKSQTKESECRLCLQVPMALAG